MSFTLSIFYYGANTDNESDTNRKSENDRQYNEQQKKDKWLRQ
jgi:hypothetical protein